MPDLSQEGIQRVLDSFRAHHPGVDTTLLTEAYTLAKDRHEGQMRQTGDPYITHPVAVTEILADYGLDIETLCAALLHDTVEDTELTLDQVAGQFGGHVAELIDGVTILDLI